MATFIVGTVNDYIFMILPVVDNFWQASPLGVCKECECVSFSWGKGVFQAQAVLMLTPRMPLYIPCVYNAFMYWPTAPWTFDCNWFKCDFCLVKFIAVHGHSY